MPRPKAFTVFTTRFLLALAEGGRGELYGKILGVGPVWVGPAANWTPAVRGAAIAFST